MRIVRVAAAFTIGAALGSVWGIAPAHAIPQQAFVFILIACLLAATTLILVRINAWPVVLALFLLIGMWRGGTAIIDETLVQNPNQSWIAFIDPATDNASYWAQSSDGDEWLDEVRSQISTALNRTVGGEGSSLAIALLTGERNGMSKRTAQNFRDAGLAHILAISGLHLSLIGGIFMWVSISIFGKRARIYLILALLTVASYAALAGFAPPVTRAAIMFTVLVTARILGRESHMIPAISLAALIMIAMNPAALKSLSLQLSFAAMLGIAFMLPKLDAMTEISVSYPKDGIVRNVWNRAMRFVLGSIAVSIAASLATAPLIAFHFQAVPLLSPISTLMVAPILPMLIISAAITSLLGSFLPHTLSNVVAIPTDIAAQYIIQTANLFATIPIGVVHSGSWSSWTVAGCYAAMAMLLLMWTYRGSVAQQRIARIAKILKPNRKALHHRHLLSSVLLATMLSLGTLFWILALDTGAEARLRVTFLHLTRGESVLIETPNGKRVLIDAGRARNEAAEKLQSIIPAWDRHIDLMLLTHPDADHLGGMKEVTERFTIGVILDAGTKSDTDTYAEWEQVISQHNEVIYPAEGMRIGLDREIFIDILSAGCDNPEGQCRELNNASIVARLSYRDVSFLFTGDIERQAEARLIAEGAPLRSTMLKVPHHGSITSSTLGFLQSVSPSVAVLTVGTENPFGHPHPEVLARITQTVGEQRILRTDTQGSVKLFTDGRRLWSAW